MRAAGDVFLWVFIAVLTAAAVMAVLVPLARASGHAGHDRARAVYLDQLGELQRDKATRGIGADEAEEARAEIARRLLATERPDQAPALTPRGPGPRRATAIVALIGIPAFSLTLYVGLGAPALPGQPLASRAPLAAPTDDIAALVGRVEAHLAKNPEDGRGWEIIAPVMARLGRPDDAARAYRSAIRILGSNAARQTGLGEAIVAGEDGIVTADARTAFEAARTADPRAPAPRFFLALAAKQDGRSGEAADAWRGLLADSPADAPWRASVEAALAQLETPSGPTAEQVAAAGTMAPADRTAMIETMVSGLADRLKSEPADVEGWLRLIRSYAVLGRTDDAEGAATAALAGVLDEPGRQRVAALIADLGLKGASSAPRATP